MDHLSGQPSLNPAPPSASSTKRKADAQSVHSDESPASVIVLPWESNSVALWIQEDDYSPKKRPKLSSSRCRSRRRHASSPPSHQPQFHISAKPPSPLSSLQYDVSDMGVVLPGCSASPSPTLITPSRPTCLFRVPSAIDFTLQPASVRFTPPSMAPSLPPINRHSLRVLDLRNILRNPQLRHDLLFDSGVQFRARDKRHLTKRYWDAVERELACNCTCATFSFDGSPRPTVCVCDKDQSKVPPDTPVVYHATAHGIITIRMPSRIRLLIKEFLDIVLCIIQPLSDLNPSIHSDVVEVQKEEHSEQARYLKTQFDVDLIYQEIVHDLFDPSGLMAVVGDTLKMHCAPMRDSAIDTMVADAASGDKFVFLKSVRSALNILEQMKIDIANHQLKVMRPLVLDSAPYFELRLLQHTHGDSLELPRTKAWLLKADLFFTEEESQCRLPYPASPTLYTMLSMRRRTFLTVAKGLVDLICDPPFALHHLKRGVSIHCGATSPITKALPGCPETTHLDHQRLNSAAIDAADLLSLYMMSMLYRTLARSKGAAKIKETEIDDLKAQLQAVGPRHPGSCFSPSMTADRSELMGMALHVATCVSRRDGDPDSTPDTAMVSLAEGWAKNNLSHHSTLSNLMRRRLSSVILHHVIDLILPYESTPLQHLVTDPVYPRPHDVCAIPLTLDPTSGLEAFALEILSLATRISSLALVHLTVYSELYEQWEIPQGV